MACSRKDLLVQEKAALRAADALYVTSPLLIVLQPSAEPFEFVLEVRRLVSS